MSNTLAGSALVLFTLPMLRHIPCSPAGPIVVADLEGRFDPADNTLIVTIDDRSVTCLALDADGPRADLRHTTLEELREGDGGLSPTFCLVAAGAGTWSAYTQMAMIGDVLVFVRLDGPDLAGDPYAPGVAQQWLHDLGARHRAHGPQLNNHQRWFINAREGLEIEQKFTLPTGTDIWALALAARGGIVRGELPGWVAEVGNDFEQWDFLNHIFEITGPEPERGYVAFIPAVAGHWIIRRKWFAADAAIRREELTDNVALPLDPDLEQVIRDRFGVEPAWSATYRRIRCNVMLESLRTGHVFSIMFDRCVTELDVADLCQAEVEYVRSRTMRRADPAADGLMDDFAEVTAWTRGLLAAARVEAVEHDLSKLTWLRDAARGAAIPS